MTTIIDTKHDISKFIGKTMTGKVFNESFDSSDTNFIKLTNATEIHRGFQFRDGLNIDTNINGSHSLGICNEGIHFTTEVYAHNWIVYNDETGIMRYMRKVTIPDDAIVFIGDKKLKTNKIILAPREIISKEIYMRIAKEYQYLLLYLPEDIIDKEICMEAVKRFCFALQYVPNHLKDKEMCMESVKKLGYMINDTPVNIIDKELCLAAVKNNGNSLQHIPISLQDEDIYMVAVKEVGYALQYVPLSLRNKEICSAAIKQNPTAIIFVPDIIKPLLIG